MPLPARWRARFRAAFRRDALDRDLDRELSQWVDELSARYEAQGISPGEARRRVLADAGGVERVKESVRDARPQLALSGLWRDMIYAARSLIRAPRLAAAIVATLALGIGANTAVYSVVYAVLLQPPPYLAPERLVLVFANMGAAGLTRVRLAGPEVVDFQTGATTLSSVAAIQAASGAVTGGGEPEQIRLARVTSNFLDVLGVQVALGRGFSADDRAPAPTPLVVATWSFFQRRLGGDATAVGRTIVLDGAPAILLGVLPQNFNLRSFAALGFPEEPQMLQLLATPLEHGHRLIRPYYVVARMADGATMVVAGREAGSIGAALAERDPIYREARHTFYLAPLVSEGAQAVRPMLLALLGGVSVVLIIACVNIGGLLLARAAGRRHEVATLVALGADRRRLVRQFIAEGLLIAGVGAIAGIATGELALRALVALRPPSLDRLQHAALNAPVLLAIAAIAGVWGVLFALAPLSECRGLHVAGGLQQHARVAGRLRYRTRSLLVILQVALGTVLVVSAGLLVRSAEALGRVDPGFSLDTRALTFRVAWPAARYPNRASVNTFSRELETRLRTIPGVQDVGTFSNLPFDDFSSWTGKYVTDARNSPNGIASAPFAEMRAVSPGALNALGARLAVGRWFTEQDDERSAAVSIVDERLASRAWPGQPAIGQRLRVPVEIDRSVAAIWTTVVGVVRPLRYRVLDLDAPEQIYVSARQILREAPTAYMVHTPIEPGRLLGEVRQAVASLDALLPAYDVRAFDSYVARAMSVRRFTAFVTSAFAFLALLLAAVGLAGLLSYSVASRHREFGVRLALGATPRQVQRRVLGEALVLVIAGIGLGVPAAVITAHAMRALLFGVESTDIASFTGGIASLCAIGALASWWPARRASHVSPVEALRAE